MNLENQPNDILLKLFNESDIPTLNRLCRTNRRFAQLCNDQQLWKNKYIEIFGTPSKTLSNWKEAFYNAIGMSKQVYIIKLMTIKEAGYYKYIEENIAVMEAYDINYIYEKLASLLNNNIYINTHLYNALDNILNNYNDMITQYFTSRGQQPEVYKPDEHGENRQELLIELPISGDDLKYMINYIEDAENPNFPSIDIEGPVPFLSIY